MPDQQEPAADPGEQAEAAAQPPWNPPKRQRAKVAERPHQRFDLKALFGFAEGGWEWSKAVSAAIAMAVSFGIVSLLIGPQSGVLAALGSFTVLYERNTPYVHRAMALALVGLGFIGCVALGSLASATPWTSAAAIGLVAAVATYICQALRVDKPAAFMFVLVAAIGSIMPGGLAAVPLHAGLTAIGASTGWLVSMVSAPFRGRHPEHRAVAQAFHQLARLLRAIGTPELDHVQHEASLAVAEAWRILLLAQTRGYRDTPTAARLRALLRWVSDIQLSATDVTLARGEPLPAQAADFADRLAAAVGKPELAPDPGELDELRRGLRPRSLEGRLYTGISRAAKVARRTDHDQTGPGLDLHDNRYPPMGTALRAGLGRDSLLLPTALRMGITVAAAGLIGLLLGFDRFYWISITAASVLQGGNVVLTVNRSTQRALGTVLGVLVGAGVLLLALPVWAIILIAALAHGTTQLLIPRNFFYASITITPMALLLSHTAQPYPVDQLVQTRLIDTLVGAAAGMIGALLLWRKASASRLPAVIASALRESQTVVAAVLDPDVELGPERRYRLRRDLRAALLSLRGVYDSAIGDVPRATQTRPLWPVVVATQRVGYLALAALAVQNPPPASYIALQRVDLAFRELIAAVEEERPHRIRALPRLMDYPRLNMELRALSTAVRSAMAEDERAADARAEPSR